MRYWMTLLAAIPILFLMQAGPAPPWAGWQAALASGHEVHDEDEARHALESGEVLPLERVLAGLGSTVPGEVSGLELEKENGIWIYEFKIISPYGRMLKVRVDAKTGQPVTKAGH